MEDSRLRDVLENREENYVFPFYWQHGDHYERIPSQVDQIFRSGCRALCVEARPHPDFCKDGWWRDMDLILSECEKRGMKVWILDDKHFPTGFANGLVDEKYPHLKQWLLHERHVDVAGPMKDAALLLDASSEEKPLLGVFAQKRVVNYGQELEGEPIDITDHVKGSILYWDIPEGFWRVFFVYQSTEGRGWMGNYIDFLNPESAALQIEGVYEPHYEKYAKYFGNVIAGFFSDEPQFGNILTEPHLTYRGGYQHRIGQEGLALPFGKRVLELMDKELGCSALPYFGELWYESPHSPLTRLAYMNAITNLYRENFAKPVGEWCRARNVEYIGHIIEDMDCHARMGMGPGHYFRAIDSQDMGGVDIVLHQVMPGFTDLMHTSTTAGGAASPEFFHYVLGKLAASISHQVPRMKGRAMCEVFGAYGWGEGTVHMKWLIDFMLVRGVNHFVPHAFPGGKFPDPDCPPHFGLEGINPEFDGFAALMTYTSKMAHLLSGGVHQAQVALLYHAEQEWMSPWDGAMLMDKPAKRLYDAHLDYDIVSIDTLENAKVENGKLAIGEERFNVLVIAKSTHIPERLKTIVKTMRQDGLRVVFAGGLPDGFECETVPLDGLAELVREMSPEAVAIEGDYPQLRVYHVKRAENDIFMFFNESFAKRAKTVASLGAKGKYARYNWLDGKAFGSECVDGRVEIDLMPGQSEVIVFGGDMGLPEMPSLSHRRELKPIYRIETSRSGDLENYSFYQNTEELFDIVGRDRLEDFDGKAKYSFGFEIDDVAQCGKTHLDLGRVGEVAKVWINGSYAGMRIAPPYVFDVSEFVKDGMNDAVVEVANTMVRKLRDPLSYFLQLPPTGLLGPVSIVRG